MPGWEEKKGKKASETWAKYKFVRWFGLVILINFVVSGLIVGVGISTYSKWSGWFGKYVMGGENQTRAIENVKEIQVTDEQSAVIEAVKKVSPAVVSIIITKDLPKIEQYYTDPFGGDSFFRQFFGDNFDWQIPQYRQNGTERQQVGGGSGFIVNSDGLIVTNKHVVDDETAEYTVLLNNGEKYDAQVLARDAVNDIAVLKIDKTDLVAIDFGDSSSLQVGQTVIAIGNALGEYRNTVSTGVVSGLERNITAGGNTGQAEQLTGVIQTDAAINPGNSGGPLLDLDGRAIGMNVAIVQGSQNIGFALPINDIRSVIDSVEKYGKIVRPWIGVRYVMINDDIKKQNQLPYDFGALVIRGETQTDLAVIPGSPADKAGIVENDIVLEIGGKALTSDYTLSQAVLKYGVGDEVELKIYHKGEEKTVVVKLEERQ